MIELRIKFDRKEYSKQWRQNNPEYFKQWRRNNPEYFKNYRQENKELLDKYAEQLLSAKSQLLQKLPNFNSWHADQVQVVLQQIERLLVHLSN